MNFQQEKSKVYVSTDEQNRITRCEGGYTMQNIEDVSNWTLIDEGVGDRYNLCQSHYFDGGLYTSDGIPRYKLSNGGAPQLRTEGEIEADRAAYRNASRIAEIKEELARTDYQIIKCSEYSLMGLPSPYDVAALHVSRQSLRDEIERLSGAEILDQI